MTIHLHSFDEAMLPITYEWLSDPELRLLTQSPSITTASQRQWYDRLAEKNDYFIKAVFAGDCAIGVMGFKHICNDQAEYFGYIGEKNWRGRGVGKQMMEMAIGIAAERKWRNVTLRVLAANFIAVNLYFSVGFRIVSFDKGIFFMNKQIAQ